MSRPGAVEGACAAGLGAAVGAVLRWAVGEATPVSADAFPWPTFAINVVGAALLALLPVALRAAGARHRLLPVLLGTGVLGGFTTMSAASTQTVVLLDGGHAATALLYAGGTLVAAVGAVLLVEALAPADRGAFDAAEGSE